MAGYDDGWNVWLAAHTHTHTHTHIHTHTHQAMMMAAMFDKLESNAKYIGLIEEILPGTGAYV
jgi:hypothetical protein